MQDQMDKTTTEAFRCHVHHFQCLTVKHSEVNILIQHIIVQDQNGQNNSMKLIFLHKIFPSEIK